MRRKRREKEKRGEEGKKRKKETLKTLLPLMSETKKGEKTCVVVATTKRVLKQRGKKRKEKAA